MTLVELTGSNGLYFINTGTPTSPIWTIIEGQIDGSMPQGADTVDAKSKSSYGWPREIHTGNKYSADFGGVVMRDDVTGHLDPGLEALRSHWHAGTRVDMLLEDPAPEGMTHATTRFAGTIAKFDKEIPFGAMHKFACTINGYGEPVYTENA